MLVFTRVFLYYTSSELQVFASKKLNAQIIALVGSKLSESVFNQWVTYTKTDIIPQWDIIKFHENKNLIRPMLIRPLHQINEQKI